MGSFLGAMVRQQLRATSVVALVFVVTACGSPTGPAHSLRLAEAMARWEAASFAAYEMDLIRGCYCGYADVGRVVTIRVADGVIAQARFKETGEPIEGAPRDALPTVASLFTLITEAIEAGAHRLFVKFDPVHGAPMSISVDYIKDAIDDELGISIIDLRSPGA